MRCQHLHFTWTWWSQLTFSFRLAQYSCEKMFAQSKKYGNVTTQKKGMKCSLAVVGSVLHSHCIAGKSTGYLKVPPSGPYKKTSKWITGWRAMSGELGSKVSKWDFSFLANPNKYLKSKITLLFFVCLPRFFIVSFLLFVSCLVIKATLKS